MKTICLFHDKISAYPLYAKILICFAAGAIMVPAMPPWNIWPLLAAGLGIFYIILNSITSSKSAVLCGWAFGFGYFLCGLSWIANALLVAGNSYVWAWPLAAAGLPAGLAIFYALAAALYKKLWPQQGHHSLRSLCGFITVIALTEWLRGTILTGFPWNLYGYSWSNLLPIAQFAALGGIYGLTLLTIFWAAAPAYIMLSHDSRHVRALVLAALIISFGSTYLYGHHRLSSVPAAFNEDILLHLVQPNIAQEDKWNQDMAAANLAKLLKLSESKEQTPASVSGTPATVIIWPETAISDFTLQNRGARNAILSTLQSYDNPVYLATGHLRFQETEADTGRQYYNSLTMFDRNLTQLSVYNKSHLVPFGEYIPFQQWIKLAPIVQFTGFVPGNGPTTEYIEGLGRYSPLICYEIIFSGNVIDKQGMRPNWLLNATNDAWYGDSAGPQQHYIMAKFRAIEQGVPTIRSANTGISGVIDPLGRDVEKIALMKSGIVKTALPKSLETPTIFAVHKNLIFFLLLALISGLSYFTLPRRDNYAEIK